MICIPELIDSLMKATITASAGVIVVAFVNYVKSKKSERDAELALAKEKTETYEEALKALSHDSFFRYCRYLLETGAAFEADLENLNYLYCSYKKLGLNGSGDELYKRCMSLPLKKLL